MKIPKLIYKYKSIEEESFAYIIDLFQSRKIYKPLIEELNDPCEGFFQYIGNENCDKNYEESDFNRMINNSRILSFSECSDNNAMWAYYTKEHKGICIEFSTKFIFTEQNPIRKVHYNKRIPEIKIAKRNYYTALLYKSNAWKHEKEWRHISSISNKFIDLDNNVITKVFFGAKINGTKKIYLLKKFTNTFLKQILYKWGFQEETIE